MAKGMTFIIAGPSGVGKGSVIKKVFESGRKLYFSVSATTRAPRPGERDGVDYHFISREQFMDWVDQGAFLEHAEFVGNCYGTPLASVQREMAAGRQVILEIEVQGALQVREKMPEAHLVFIEPPSLEELERRLRGRGTEADDEDGDENEAAYEEGYSDGYRDGQIAAAQLPAEPKATEQKPAANDAAIEELARTLATIFGGGLANPKG